MSRCEFCFDGVCVIVRVMENPVLHPRHCESADDVGNKPEDVVHRLALDSCVIGDTEEDGEEVRPPHSSSRVARRVCCVWSNGIH